MRGNSVCLLSSTSPNWMSRCLSLPAGQAVAAALVAAACSDGAAPKHRPVAPRRPACR